VAGVTDSEDFPRTAGGAQKSNKGGSDALVARLNKELTQILKSTYLGGSGDDDANALAIHPQTGEVYVAGNTSSKDFPAGGAQKSNKGGSDAFVARLNKELTQILQATYLGGSGGDETRALTIHLQTGEVYVAGETKSKDFPKTTGGAQENFRCSPDTRFYGCDAFVARLNSDLTQILQSTYLGGSEWDEAYSLAIHPQTGEVYVAGNTSSKDFPKTAGGAQKRCNNCVSNLANPSYDVFVARLNKDLTQILQATYLGGSDSERAYSLAIHPQTGEVYVAGDTHSKDFPKTTGGAQARRRAYNNLFVARLNKDLTQILQSTYLGGSGIDETRALAIHPKTGEVYVAGYTESFDFPKTAGGAQPKCNECSYKLHSYDAFVARLNSNLTQILQSTYLGGSYNDEAYALAIHLQTGEIYVAGYTYSDDFPKTAGGAQTKCNECFAVRAGGVGDAFVARLTADLAAGRKSSDGGGSHMTGSISFLTGAWNILLLLSVPAFALARRIRRR
jgi:secreted PhoX family phosphatase